MMNERFGMGCLLCFLGDWTLLILILLILVSFNRWFGIQLNPQFMGIDIKYVIESSTLWTWNSMFNLLETFWIPYT